VVVVLAALCIAGVWANNADTDSAGEAAIVSEDFISGEEAVTPSTVQSLTVALNPETAVVAKTVAHLPSHSENVADSDEEDSDVEADEEGREPATLYSARFSQLHADPAAMPAPMSAPTAPAAPPAPSPAPSSQPIKQLKAALSGKAKGKGASKGPGMDTDPTPGKNDRANAYPAPGTPFQPMKVVHHAGGLEDAPAAGTVSMEAGDELPADFDEKKEEKKKCPGGCSRKLPIVIGTGGHNERPSKEWNRHVRLPGDHAMWKQIHNELKTSHRTSWQQLHLNNARRKLRASTRIIDRLRTKRKALEVNPLARRVYT